LQAGVTGSIPVTSTQLNSRIRESESKALRDGVAVRILAVSEIVRQVDADKLNPGISGGFLCRSQELGGRRRINHGLTKTPTRWVGSGVATAPRYVQHDVLPLPGSPNRGNSTVHVEIVSATPFQELATASTECVQQTALAQTQEKNWPESGIAITRGINELKLFWVGAPDEARKSPGFGQEEGSCDRRT